MKNLESTINIKNKVFNPCLIMFFWVLIINGLYLLYIDHILNPDEFSAIGTVAYLSGRDWLPLLSQSSYHGIGFTLLLLPFFFFISNGTWMYRICLFLCLLLRVGCSFLTFSLCLNLFKLKKRDSLCISLLCDCGMLAYDAAGQTLSAMSEIPSTFTLLLSAWLFYKGCFSRKKIYFIICSMVLAYGSTIHTRFLVAYIAIGFLIIIYAVKNGNLKEVLFIGMTFLLFYFLFSKLTDYVVSKTYIGKTTDELLTSTSVFSRILPILYSLPMRIKTILFTLGSQLGAYSLYSFGFIWFFVFEGIALLRDDLKNRKTEVILFRDYIMIFGFLSFFGMILAISVNSTGAVIDGNYRWLTYLRYSMPYAWIVVMTGFSSFLIHYEECKRIKVFPFLLSLLASKFFVTFSAHELQESGYGMKYTFFNRIDFGILNKEDSLSYFACLMVLCIVTTLTIYILRFKKYCIMCIYFAISIVIYFQSFDYYIMKGKDYALLNKPINSVLMDDFFGDYNDIYMVDNIKNMFATQIELADKTIIPVEIEQAETLDTGIIISNTKLKTDFYCAPITDKEYVYFSNERAFEYFVDHFDNM